MKNKLMKQNYDFFLSQLPRLLENKNNIGNYVLIENRKIIGIYDTFLSPTFWFINPTDYIRELTVF